MVQIKMICNYNGTELKAIKYKTHGSEKKLKVTPHFIYFKNNMFQK